MLCNGLILQNLYPSVGNGRKTMVNKIWVVIFISTYAFFLQLGTSVAVSINPPSQEYVTRGNYTQKYKECFSVS